MLHGASHSSSVPAGSQAPAGRLTWFSPSLPKKGQRPIGTLDRRRDRVNGMVASGVVSLRSPDRFVSYGRRGGVGAWAGWRGRGLGGVAGGGIECELVVADLNHDIIPDLAVADFGSGDVSVLLGNGDGSFQPAHTFAAGSNPGALLVGDFNGDGVPELVVANDTNPGTVSVLLGNGDGSFQAPRESAAGAFPGSL